MIDGQSLGSGSLSDAVARQVLAGVLTSDGREANFPRLSGSPLGSTRPAEETKTDLKLVLSQRQRSSGSGSGVRFPFAGNSEIGESHTSGQPSESGFDAVGSALALMSKRDFLRFTEKFQ